MSSKIIASTTSGTALNMSADTSGILEIQTGSTPTTAITIDASQNVGIGTASPAAKLNVTGHSSNLIASFNKGATTQGYVRLSNSAQAYDTYVDINNNGSNVWALFDGTGAQYIDSYNPGASGYRAFYTVGTERMRIDSRGNLLVGTTNSDPVTNGVNGVVINQSGFVLRTPTNTNRWGLDATSGNHIRFFTSGATSAGIISSNGATTTYGTGSDYRMKENIALMTGALDTVTKLKPVTYKWKPEFAGTNINGQGFIAHELQAVVPDCVTGEKDAVDADGNPVYQGIDTSFLVATLTASIQELKAIVDAQNNTIETMQAKLKDAGVLGF